MADENVTKNNVINGEGSCLNDGSFSRKSNVWFQVLVFFGGLMLPLAVAESFDSLYFHFISIQPYETTPPGITEKFLDFVNYVDPLWPLLISMVPLAVLAICRRRKNLLFSIALWTGIVIGLFSSFI